MSVVLVVLAALAQLPAVPASAAPAPPVYVKTLGNPDCRPGEPDCGQALMYSSGGDVDAAGNIFIADTGNSQVASFTQAGTQRWRVGQGQGNKKTLGQFLNPRDLAYLNAPGFRGLNDKGLLFIADLGNNRVQVLNAADGSTSALQSGWTTRFTSIIGITAGVNAQGAPIILATDSVAAPVRTFTPGGKLLASVGGKCTVSPLNCGVDVLTGPRDAATDADGNIYVADYGNNRIVEFAAAAPHRGVRAFGVRGTGRLEFNHPYGVAFDDQGRLYVADSDNHRIQQFDVSGAPRYLATYGSKDAAAGSGGFFNLRRVAVMRGSSPRVVGFDLWGNALDVFRQPASYPGTGTLATYIGGRPAAEGAFNSPYGVTVANGKLLVADTNNQRFQVWNRSTNTFNFSFGRRGFGESDLGFNWPRSAAYAPATNTVWIADTKNFRISEYTMAGTATGRTFGNKTMLQWPFGVAAHGTNVVVADTLNNRVQLWNPGTERVVWSTDSLGISMQQPRALTIADDPLNPGKRILYVTDSIGQRLLVLDASTGRLLRTIAPTINGVRAFHRIEGVAVDPRSGSIWISDSSWNRLLKVSPDGRTVQVNFGTAGSGNNQFQYPANLAIAAVAGRQTLYVADYWNNRVQVFDISAS